MPKTREHKPRQQGRRYYDFNRGAMTFVYGIMAIIYLCIGFTLGRCTL